MVSDELLTILKARQGDFLSGEAISRMYGISRAAVWKKLKKLKDDGYEIEAVSGKGYRLISGPDLLTEGEISPYLKTRKIGRKIIHHECVASTSDVLKKLAESGEAEGTVVFAEEQSRGRGRTGTQWTAPDRKDVLMSVLLRPEISMAEIPSFAETIGKAVADAIGKTGADAAGESGADAARESGTDAARESGADETKESGADETKKSRIDASLRMPGDILIGGRKVCGILTESAGELDRVRYVIFGIGVHVSETKEELKGSGLTSLYAETGKKILRPSLAAAICNEIEAALESPAAAERE